MLLLLLLLLCTLVWARNCHKWSNLCIAQFVAYFALVFPALRFSSKSFNASSRGCWRPRAACNAYGIGNEFGLKFFLAACFCCSIALLKSGIATEKLTKLSTIRNWTAHAEAVFAWHVVSGVLAARCRAGIIALRKGLLLEDAWWYND